MSAAIQPPPPLHGATKKAVWTHAQLTNLRVIWVDPGWGIRSIAAAVKHSPENCRRIARELGLGDRPKLYHVGKKATWRTTERLAILRRDWPTGRAVRAIADEMNALPGDPVPGVSNVGEWASSLLLRRPERYRDPAQGKPLRRVRKPPQPQEQPSNVVLFKRSCLRCSRAFGAETKFIRMCPSCRHT